MPERSAVACCVCGVFRRNQPQCLAIGSFGGTTTMPLKEDLMKRAILAAVAVAALMSGSALAQSTTVTTTTPGAGTSVVIAPEQRTKIKQYVVQQKVRPAVVKEKIVVGATLPS